MSWASDEDLQRIAIPIEGIPLSGTRRAIPEAFGRLLSEFPFELFVSSDTGTYPFRSRYDAIHKTTNWCESLRSFHRHPVLWTFTVERGRSGHWGAHILLGGITSDDLRGPFSLACQIWKTKGYGPLDIQRIRPGTLDRVGSYITKRYLFAEIQFCDDLASWKGRPRVLTTRAEREAMLDMFYARLNMIPRTVDPDFDDIGFPPPEQGGLPTPVVTGRFAISTQSSKGGRAGAAKMSKEERSERARNAALARWRRTTRASRI